MKWLYLDAKTLENAARANGLKFQIILKEEDSYLAKLTKQI